jgi:hypothetical protein
MSLTLGNPTYATSGPAKTGQVLAPNEQTGLEVAFIGRSIITLDASTKTGTVNFIDGTQTVFASGNAAGSTVAPTSVVANVIGALGANSTANLEAITVNTGTPTTTGFPIYLTAAVTSATAETGTVTSWSITSNVITFTTSAMSAAITTGQVFTPSGFTTGAFFNGLVLTALSGGSTTSTTANLTHANVTTVTEGGTLTAAADTITVQFSVYKN